MKFKNDIEAEAIIEVQSGLKDKDNLLGSAGQLLSSTGSQVSWVDASGLSAKTAETVVQPIKANEALSKGDPLYIVGFQAGQNVNIVAKADASNSAKMPVVGLADDDYSNQDFGTMTAFGSFNGAFDTTGGTESWSIGDIIYVKPGGGLTNVKPTGTNLIQNIAIVSRVQQNTGELEVIALGRTNDVPNLPTGRLFVGTATNTSLSSNVVYIDDANDRVGIGTASPNRLLHLESTGDTIIQITSADGSGAYIDLGDVSDVNGGRIVYDSGSNLILNTASAERLRITSSGNVGIGTTSPAEKLEVSGGHAKITNSGNANLYINANNSGSDATIFFEELDSVKAKIQHDASNDSMLFTDGSYTDTMTLKSGNVGIGTTSPTAKLEVASTGTGDSILVTNNDATSDAAPILTLKRDSASPADGDYLGQIKFKGENDASQEIVYAKITAKTSDVTDTTEDGLIETAVKSGGSNVIVSRQTGTDLKLINGVGLEVDGDATFAGSVGVGGSPGAKLDVNAGATNTVAIFESTDDKALIILKDDTTSTHLITKDNKFSIGESSTDYDNFKVDISTGDATFAGDLTVSGGDIVLGGTGRIQGIDTVSASTDAANKAYVDAQIGTSNELSEVLANGNTTGGTDIVVSTSDQIFLPNGSATNPSLAFSSDTDTGIYYTTNDISFAVSGSEQASIGNSQITLQQSLTVNDTIKANDRINIEGTTNPYLVIQDTTNEKYLHLVSSDNESALVYSQDTFKISSGLDFANQTPRLTINSSGNATFSGDLTVSGGDISLGGTGRIQGIDTVSSGTDAANKAYVDNAIAGVPQGDITAVTAGNHLTGGGVSGSVTLNADNTTLAHIVDSSNGSVNAGWITVAQASTARKAGEVYVTDGESGDHSYIRIEWMRSYADSNFTVLNCGGHSNRIQGVRVLQQSSDATYGPKYLQVKVTTTSNYHVIVTAPGTIPNYSDFTAETPVLENTKTGYAVTGAQLEDLQNSSVGTDEGITIGGDLVVNGGDIVLGGTGRIQGIDTVTNTTDAANKTYVDNAISGVPQGTVTKSGTPVNNQLAVWTSATNIEGESELTYDGSKLTVGGTGNTETFLDIVGTNTAGSPATAAALRIYGYEGRGEGIFYYDSAYASSEWYSGVPYSGGDSWQIGYDASGNQAQHTANAALRINSLKNATFSGDVSLPDNKKLNFGASQDLQIYHDGSHSRIKDVGTGSLTINATDFVVNNSADTKNMIIAVDGGATTLFCNGAGKLATTSTGISVTGNGIFTGNVGIGTTSPSAKLEVKNGNSGQTYSNVSGALIDVNGTSNSYYGLRVGSSTGNSHLAVTNAGNVGIGTASPGRQLELRGEGVVRLNSISGGDPGIDFNTSDVNDMQIRYRASTDVLAIYSYGTSSDVLTIKKSNGNVGIGTTNPATRLHVSSSDQSTARIRLSNTNTGSGGDNIDLVAGVNNVTQDGFSIYNATSNQTQLVIQGTGNVGIGTTSPSEKLQVEGKVYIQGNGQNWNETTPGTTRGSVHFDPGTNVANTGNALTFGASDTPGSPNEGSNAQAGIYTRSDGTYGTKMYFATTDSYASGSKTAMMIDYNANVGIGTTSPLEPLSINSGTNESVYDVLGVYNNVTTTSAVGKGAAIRIGLLADGRYSTKIATIYEDNNPSFLQPALAFFTMNNSYLKGSETERMRISSNGNVGIGATNPGAKLQIGSATYAPNTNLSNNLLQIKSPSGYAYLTIGNGDTANSTSYIGGASGFTVIGSVTDAGALSEHMRIDSSGKVGIGTTSPNQKLTIKGTDQYLAAEQTSYAWGGTNTIGVRMGTNSTAGLLDFRRWSGTFTIHGTALITQVNSDGGYGLDFKVDTKGTNTAATTSRMFLSQSGEVGIGTTSPGYKLDVSGTGRFTSTVTATNFILSSDKRKKTKIKDLICDNIDVNWKSFELKENEGEYRTGVIAQELEEVHPEFVNTDKEGFKSVKYIDLLIAKIAELEARLEKLEK